MQNIQNKKYKKNYNIIKYLHMNKSNFLIKFIQPKNIKLGKYV
jgi:hypothetical protein